MTHHVHVIPQEVIIDIVCGFCQQAYTAKLRYYKVILLGKLTPQCSVLGGRARPPWPPGSYSTAISPTDYVMLRTIRIYWLAFTPVRAHKSTDKSCFAANGSPYMVVPGHPPSRRVTGR